MKVRNMKAAIFNRPAPGRIAFTMTRTDLLRLSVNAFLAAVRGAEGIAIGTGDLELLSAPENESEEKR